MRKGIRIGLAVGWSLLAVTVAYAQFQAPADRVTAKIPFAFTAAGKLMPAGQYEFTANAEGTTVSVQSADRKVDGFDPVLTRLASAIHTSANDAHIVFDKIGNNYTLSELWVPGSDGFVLSETKLAHQHSVIDVPMARR